jgi:hypothetical protein
MRSLLQFAPACSVAASHQKEHSMKTPKLKPRNPVAVAAHLRSGAGAHRKSNKALRQAALRQLRRSLKGEVDSGQCIVVVH